VTGILLCNGRLREKNNEKEENKHETGEEVGRYDNVMSG
jgi:hypothetical protein